MASEHVDEELPDEGRMTLLEHLGELRRRLVISIIAVVVGGVVAFVLFDRITDVLAGPYRDVTTTPEMPEGRSLIFTDPLEGFVVRLKVSTYAGIVFAMPILLWQLWRFVTPGLYPKEKRYAVPFVVSSVALFALGATVAWLMLPQALSFLIGVSGPNLEPLLSANRYLSLVSLLFLAFGLAFELPLLLVFLLMARVVTTVQLRRVRRYAIVGIAILSAVISPGDPYSMLALTIPLYLFYELTILVGRLMHR